jgi:hypothetical protein
VQERGDPEAQISPTMSQLKPLDLPNPDVIIRSSDNVDFRVHKPVLAVASPNLKRILSCPRPFIDGLPMVKLSEDSELLNSLVSTLYPVRTVLPNSYEKVLYLLAICQR